MKKIYTLIASIVLVGSMAVLANPQTGSHSRLIANIPFEFSVSDKILPAGEYEVVQVNPASDVAVLRFTYNGGNASAVIAMRTVEGRDKEPTRLTFHRYGDRYFFAQAWMANDRTGLQAETSRAERAAQKQLASMKARTQTIALRNR